MKTFMTLVFLWLLLLTPSVGKTSEASTHKNRKTPSREQADLQGTRKPDSVEGAEKKPLDFVPLYKVRARIDINIKNSVDYLK